MVLRRDKGLSITEAVYAHYAGISRKRIQEWLNSNEDHYKLDPMFRNKGPIALVESRRPIGRHQVDLVDYSLSPSKACDGKTYRYVLGIIQDSFFCGDWKVSILMSLPRNSQHVTASLASPASCSAIGELSSAAALTTIANERELK